MNIEYTTTRIGNLKVLTDAVNGKKNKVSGIEFQGSLLKPSTRFWTSLCAKFGFNATIFKYFSHEEVFDRLAKQHSGGEIRITVEKTAKETNLLGVSNPLKAVANYDQLLDTLGRHGAEDIKYANGMVTSRHSPRLDQGFTTVGDEFKAKFFLNTPIDGYGCPSSYLGFLRLVCSNGMMALTRAFRSELKLGRGEDNCMPTVVRSLESFNNEDGYSALQSRIQDSAKSWASVYEAGSLRKILEKINVENEIDLKFIHSGTRLSNVFSNIACVEKYHQTQGNPIFKAFNSMTGDENVIYGYANMEALSMKRRRTLPVKCSVYDLYNFATEVATHHAKPAAAALLQAWLGETVSNEYDLENTMNSHSEFADFHVNSTTEVAGKAGIN
jgi:hypothetical protein